MAIDLGAKRIGIALSDEAGLIARPYRVLERRGGRQDLELLVRLAEEQGVERIIVGWPLDLRGTEGTAAQNVAAEIEALRRLTGIPIETCDERLTTAVAQRALREGGKDSRTQREVVDKIAAALLLQSYLEMKRHNNERAEA